MKNIFYTRTTSDGHVPFWMPWGGLGCLGRVLLFALMLFVFFVLMSLVRRCERTELKDIIIHPVDTVAVRDSSELYNPGNDSETDPGTYPVTDPGVNPGIGAGGNMPGYIDSPGRNLPPRERNLIPPVDDKDIIDDDRNKTRIVAGRLNIIFDSDAGDELFLQFADAFKSAFPDKSCQIVYYNTLTKLMQIQVPESMREQIKEELPYRIPDISFKVFDETVFESFSEYDSMIPDDLGFQYEELSWYFEPVQAYDAWEITMGSPEIVVAIVDSYFDMSHIELDRSRIVNPYSVRFRSRDVRPTRDCPKDNPAFMHGTAVAAQAVGSDNKSFLCGMAPECSLMPISMGHQFTSMTILEGVLYAVYQGADVVNISAGTDFGDLLDGLTEEEQIELSENIGLDAEDVWEYVFSIADERNVMIVWSAGNNDLFSGLDCSKRGSTTIRVAALDHKLRKADFSNFGNVESMDVYESTVSAPGVDILCPMPFNDCTIGQGTSFSAPIVTGAVALMKSIDRTLTNKEIVEILQRTGIPVDRSPEIGPRLQIRAALDAVADQFISFDDLFGNRESLIGTWRTTEILDRVEGDKVYPREVSVYFQIPEVDSGYVRYFEPVTTKDIFSASIDITWHSDKLEFKQAAYAVSEDSDGRYVHCSFILCPDGENGLLACHWTTENGNKGYSYVKKISDNPYMNIK